MKLKLLILNLFVFLIFGCNSSSKEKKEKELPQKEVLKNDSVYQKNLEIEETKSIDNYYLISTNSAGIFKIGNQIPFPETSDNYKINKKTQIKMTEEGPSEELIYIVNSKGNDILYLLPEYNYQTEKYTKKIGEIIIFSEKFKTPDGIGVDSTIEDFIKIYPRHTIWYSYVSDMYIIDTKEINAQFILNEKDFIGNLELSSDMTRLKKSDFKSGAKILKIRII